MTIRKTFLKFSLIALALLCFSQPRNVRSFAREGESAKGVIFADANNPPPPNTVYLDITPCNPYERKEYIPFRKKYDQIELNETAKPCGKKLVQLTQLQLEP